MLAAAARGARRAAALTRSLTQTLAMTRDPDPGPSLDLTAGRSPGRHSLNTGQRHQQVLAWLRRLLRLTARDQPECRKHIRSSQRRSAAAVVGLWLVVAATLGSNVPGALQLMLCAC